MQHIRIDSLSYMQREREAKLGRRVKAVVKIATEAFAFIALITVVVVGILLLSPETKADPATIVAQSNY